MNPFLFSHYSVASARHPERNEDSFIADQESGIAGVFDGVGTAGQAKVSASQIAATVIEQGWKQFLQQKQSENTLLTLAAQETGLDLEASLIRLVEEASGQIRAANTRNLFKKAAHQATTIVLAALCRQPETSEYVLAFVSSGDSRLYLLREHQRLTCLTRDDGLLTRLIEEQKVTEEDALRIDQATHPDQLSETELSYFKKRHEIFQALGERKPFRGQRDQIVIQPGDRILLCSDGIHDNLTNDEIEEVVKQTPPAEVAQVLVEHAALRSRQESSMTMRAKADDMTAVVITYRTDENQA
jgi:serine/threonine protein phosphatase PrpC